MFFNELETDDQSQPGTRLSGGPGCRMELSKAEQFSLFIQWDTNTIILNNNVKRFFFGHRFNRDGSFFGCEFDRVADEVAQNGVDHVSVSIDIGRFRYKV